MIYTIEKRNSFDGAQMFTRYEVRQYERRTAIGVLVGGKTLKVCKTKTQAKDYCGKKGIKYEEAQNV